MDTYEGRNGEPLTLHKYLYTHGSPVNGTDPSGNFNLLETGIVQFIIKHPLISATAGTGIIILGIVITKRVLRWSRSRESLNLAQSIVTENDLPNEDTLENNAVIHAIATAIYAHRYNPEEALKAMNEREGEGPASDMDRFNNEVGSTLGGTQDIGKFLRCNTFQYRHTRHDPYEFLPISFDVAEKFNYDTIEQLTTRTLSIP